MFPFCHRERYRDLIDAADSIVDMKTCAEHVRHLILISAQIPIDVFLLLLSFSPLSLSLSLSLIFLSSPLPPSHTSSSSFPVPLSGSPLSVDHGATLPEATADPLSQGLRWTTRASNQMVG